MKETGVTRIISMSTIYTTNYMPSKVRNNIKLIIFFLSKQSSWEYEYNPHHSAGKQTFHTLIDGIIHDQFTVFVKLIIKNKTYKRETCFFVQAIKDTLCTHSNVLE